MRYEVLDLPPGKVAAFTPIPTTDNEPATFADLAVFGAPGTLPVPAPNPGESMPSLSSQPHGKNSAQGSDIAPDVFLPNLFLALVTRRMGPTGDAGIGMARRRRNELPVPALNPTRVPTSDSFVTSKGGRSSMAWPRAFQRFPTAGGV